MITETPVAPASKASLTDHPPGDRAGGLRVGDFLLTGITRRGRVSLAIKIGSLLRGYNRDFRRFSHAALVIGPDGTLAEALATGATPQSYRQVRFRQLPDHPDARRPA